MKRTILTTWLVCALTAGAAAVADSDLAAALEQARRTFDTEALLRVQQDAEREAKATPASCGAQLLPAKAALLRADQLRNERMILDLSKQEANARQDEQKDIAKAAIPFAHAALKLAHDNAERAKASRILGELYAHQITGMVSGMRYGSKSRDLIDAALALQPDDPENLRANGLMFLYNPPMTGGDVDKAIATFQRCSELRPDSDVYPVYLAQAYRKKGDEEQARAAAEAALALNPENQDAANLLKELAKTDVQ